MLESGLETLVGVLALLGAVALFVRLVRTGMRIMMHAAEAAAASGRAVAGARRGDVTAMIDGRATVDRERRAIYRYGLLGTLLLLWFAVPLAFGFTAVAWALAALLWLLPSAPSRRHLRGPDRRASHAPGAAPPREGTSRAPGQAEQRHRREQGSSE